MSLAVFFAVFTCIGEFFVVVKHKPGCLPNSLSQASRSNSSPVFELSQDSFAATYAELRAVSSNAGIVLKI